MAVGISGVSSLELCLHFEMQLEVYLLGLPGLPIPKELCLDYYFLISICYLQHRRICVGQ